MPLTIHHLPIEDFLTLKDYAFDAEVDLNEIRLKLTGAPHLSIDIMIINGCVSVYIYDEDSLETGFPVVVTVAHDVDAVIKQAGEE